MRLDLSADPWGAAMVAAGAVVVLGLLIAVIALAMRTSQRAAGWLLGLGCAAFLGTAVGGTFAQIRAHDAATAKANKPKVEGKTLEAPPVSDGEGEGEADASSGAEAAGDSGAPPPDPAEGVGAAGADADEPAHDEPAHEPAPDEPAPDEPAPDATPDAAAEPATPVTAGLPDDPAERKAEVLARLRDAQKIVDDDEDCRDPAKLQSSWASVSALPTDVVKGKVQAVAKSIEQCRRRLVGGRQWTLRKELEKAREGFPDVFKKRMDEKGVGSWASTTGSDHGKFNAGGKSFDPQFVADLLDGGLRDELTELGFAKAAFMNGTDVTKEELSPKSVDDRVDDELSSFGLSHPLALK